MPRGPSVCSVPWGSSPIKTARLVKIARRVPSVMWRELKAAHCAQLAPTNPMQANRLVLIVARVPKAVRTGPPVQIAPRALSGLLLGRVVWIARLGNINHRRVNWLVWIVRWASTKILLVKPTVKRAQRVDSKMSSAKLTASCAALEVTNPRWGKVSVCFVKPVSKAVKTAPAVSTVTLGNSQRAMAKAAWLVRPEAFSH